MFFKRVSCLFKQNANQIYVHVRKYSVEPIKSDSVPAGDLVQRVLKVAVIGMPNAGKSTFINNLMDRKVCATSSKVHTTRKKTQSIFTEGDAQIIFMDTPGVVSLNEYKKFKLERSFMKDSKMSLQESDIIGVIHDVGNPHTQNRLELKIISLLEANLNKPSFLVLNKVDMLKSKRKLLDLTRLLTENYLNGKPLSSGKEVKVSTEEFRGWKLFQEIFMISATTGTGMEDVRNYLIKRSKPGDWLYPSNVWSDQAPEQIVLNAVKAKFLDFLAKELPYELRTEMELFEVNNEGVITTVVNVHVPTARKAKLIAGDGGGRLRQIIACVQEDLQHAFHNFVRLNIVLKSANYGE